MTYKKGQKVRVDKNKHYYPSDIEVLEKTNFILTIKKRHFLQMIGKNMYEVEEMPRMIPKNIIMEIVT